MANNVQIGNPLVPKPQQKKGSGFVNLGKVLEANKANQLGQSVAQGIGQGAQGVQQGLGQLKTGFQEAAEKGNLATDANRSAVSQALSNIASGKTDLTEDQIKQFGTFRAGQYAGPRELDQTKTVQLGSKAQEAEQMGRDLLGGGDKTRVLQAFAGKGPYSAGQSRLDALLLGKGPGAAQQLAEARQQTRGLTQQIGREQETAQQLGQLRAGQAQEFGKQVVGELGSATGTLETAIGNKAQQYNRIQDIAYRSLTGQPINPEEQALLQQSGVNLDRGGVSTKTYDTFGIKANNQRYYTPQMAATVHSAATPEERARIESLYKLSGKDQTFLQNAQAYDPTKPVTFEKDIFLGDVGRAKEDYSNKGQQLSGALKQLDEQFQNKPSYRKSLGSSGAAALAQREREELQDYYNKRYEIEKAQYDLRNTYGQTGAGHYVPVLKKVQTPAPAAPGTRRKT